MSSVEEMIADVQKNIARYEDEERRRRDRSRMVIPIIRTRRELQWRHGRWVSLPLQYEELGSRVPTTEGPIKFMLGADEVLDLTKLRSDPSGFIPKV